ncbi:MAG: GntR family transcriptional regulator [Bacteroidales bacterium]|nr:GntR family transcriptional regulator [Bacteroidales bacterium]
MNFNADKPIYLQIADSISERILSGELKGDDRIPSVREYGAEIGVNPNTMMRSYDKLLSEEILYNKRGIGYFVAPDAREKVLSVQREAFLREELPVIRRRMQLLGLDASVFNQ